MSSERLARRPNSNLVIIESKAFHEAMGHPTNEVTRLLAQSCHGCPVMHGYADKCAYCLSRRRRRQPSRRVEDLDRTQWRIGEKWSMDFTAMTLMKSHDKNQVGIVFVEGETDMIVGQPLHDHTEICIALDWLYSYVRRGGAVN